MPRGQKESAEIQVVDIRTGEVTVCLLGTQPLIYNAMSEKAKHELLLPKGRKTTADKMANLKHDPPAEFRNSTYQWRDEERRPTRLRFPAAAFRKSMGAAALDLPGLKKAQIERLVWIDVQSIDMYGVPQLLMSVVRSADINRTPDIRTRAILPRWTCQFSIKFVESIIKPAQIAKLLAAAGILTGVGDWRQQKGGGSFGQFQVVNPDDPTVKALMKNEGRAAQDAAIKNPACYDDETEKLLSWYHEEVKIRGVGPTKKAAA